VHTEHRHSDFAADTMQCNPQSVTHSANLSSITTITQALKAADQVALAADTALRVPMPTRTASAYGIPSSSLDFLLHDRDDLDATLLLFRLALSVATVFPVSDGAEFDSFGAVVVVGVAGDCGEGPESALSAVVVLVALSLLGALARFAAHCSLLDSVLAPWAAAEGVKSEGGFVLGRVRGVVGRSGGVVVLVVTSQISKDHASAALMTVIRAAQVAAAESAREPARDHRFERGYAGACDADVDFEARPDCRKRIVVGDICGLEKD
jgi:hypothetical protein